MDVQFSVTRFPLKNCPGRGGIEPPFASGRQAVNARQIDPRPLADRVAAFRSVPASTIDSGIRHARPNLRTCRHTTDEGPRQRASGRRTGGDTTGLTQAALSATGSPAGHDGGRPQTPFNPGTAGERVRCART